MGEGSSNNLEKMFEAVMKRFDMIDGRFTNMENRMQVQEEKVNSLVNGTPPHQQGIGTSASPSTPSTPLDPNLMQQGIHDQAIYAQRGIPFHENQPQLQQRRVNPQNRQPPQEEHINLEEEEDHVQNAMRQQAWKGYQQLRYNHDEHERGLNTIKITLPPFKGSRDPEEYLD
ncbi:hypothetical protein A4A49_14344 [Nicotiana attenuata]|uniref:Uncharacterized protein n=1 Tax=Nicotiana attenuata TaxID=49451 RepID=A0A1J6I7D7_NICAT|nr:hypothetical protein A4A49_14344 [Nicotiana attenuata]